MNADSAFAVQAAIYDLLGGVDSLAGRVFDHVPPGTPFPYVTVGEMTSRPFDTQESSGCELSAAIHVYSRGQGMLEARALMAAVYGALHEADLGVAGHALILCRHAGAEILLESDGETRHGVTRFHIITEAL
jgi:hypothetical protein